MKELTPWEQYQIEQVVATMAIEDMPLQPDTYQTIVDIVADKKTVNQAIRELDEEYANG